MEARRLEQQPPCSMKKLSGTHSITMQFWKAKRSDGRKPFMISSAGWLKLAEGRECLASVLQRANQRVTRRTCTAFRNAQARRKELRPLHLTYISG